MVLKSQVKEPVVEEMKKVNENQYLMNNIYQLKMNSEQKKTNNDVANSRQFVANLSPNCS